MLSVAEDLRKALITLIMRLQQICAFVGRAVKNELTASCSLSVHSPSMDSEIQLKLHGLFQYKYMGICVCVAVWVCIVRTHDCISVYEWDVRVCLDPARLQVCLGTIFASAFIPAALPLSPIWKVEEHYYMVHLLPSSTALGYKVSDEVYLCKLFFFGGGDITYMAAAFTWTFFPKAWLSI